jgi:hypothetical protein
MQACSSSWPSFNWLTYEYVPMRQRDRQNEDIPNTVSYLLFFYGKKVLSRAKTLISIQCSYTSTLSTGKDKRAPWHLLRISDGSKSKTATKSWKVETQRKRVGNSE